MGVEYEYFYAADDAAAVDLADRLGADGVDSVYSKGIEPAVIVGKLVAHVRGVEWAVDTVRTGPPLPDDGDHGGPWTFSIDDGVRDTLAHIEDARLRELAGWWGQIPELSWGEPLSEEEMLPVLTDLVELARRAQAAGQHVYCWCSL